MKCVCDVLCKGKEFVCIVVVYFKVEGMEDEESGQMMVFVESYCPPCNVLYPIYIVVC